ncbi:hypothetical protein [Rufibacter roseus]|uniref:Uncharacterized protein n=1 Tax=Rufibacter roseus TaxID=1567108 RepID=A0ABW2DR71_9BACT|nr:hypothetical protein [Rufibacter roseus]
MGLLDLLSELPIFLSSVSDERNRKKKNSLIRTFSILLFIVGTIWLVRELPIIKDLVNPVMFISLSGLASLVLAILLIIGLFNLGLLNSISPTDFALIVLAVSLNLFCITSYFNKESGYKLMKISSANVSEKYLTPNKA